MRMVPLGLIVLLMVGPMAGCLGSEDGTEPLVVLTYSAFDGDDEIIDAFTNATGIDVELVRVENSAAILERAMQTAGTDRFDVLLGLDTAYAPIALDAGLLMEHDATLPELALLSEPRHDPDRLVPFDQGYVCLNDSSFANGTDVPFDLMEFTEPQGRQGQFRHLWGRVQVVLVAMTQMPVDDEHGRIAGGVHANDLIPTSGWSQAYEILLRWIRRLEAGHRRRTSCPRTAIVRGKPTGEEVRPQASLDVPGTMLQVDVAS